MDRPELSWFRILMVVQLKCTSIDGGPGLLGMMEGCMYAWEELFDLLFCQGKVLMVWKLSILDTWAFLRQWFHWFAMDSAYDSDMDIFINRRVYQATLLVEEAERRWIFVWRNPVSLAWTLKLISIRSSFAESTNEIESSLSHLSTGKPRTLIQPHKKVQLVPWSIPLDSIGNKRVDRSALFADIYRNP